MEQEIAKLILSRCSLETVACFVALWLIYRNLNKVQDKIDNVEKELDGMNGAIRAGLLSHITRIFDGAIKNGYISMDTANIVEEDYRQYHARGGDGLADNMMKIIRSLPPK